MNHSTSGCASHHHTQNTPLRVLETSGTSPRDVVCMDASMVAVAVVVVAVVVAVLVLQRWGE